MFVRDTWNTRAAVALARWVETARHVQSGAETFESRAGHLVNLMAAIDGGLTPTLIEQCDPTQSAAAVRELEQLRTELRQASPEDFTAAVGVMDLSVPDSSFSSFTARVRVVLLDQIIAAFEPSDPAVLDVLPAWLLHPTATLTPVLFDTQQVAVRQQSRDVVAGLVRSLHGDEVLEVLAVMRADQKTVADAASVAVAALR